MDNQVIPQVTSQPQEQALIGWAAIASFFQATPRLMKSRASELRQAGVVFYRWDGNGDEGLSIAG